LSLASPAVAPYASARLSAAVERLLAWLTASHVRAALALVMLAVLAFAPGQFALQPMDRDEPRFAQATKQMLETGDFVDIRFQDEARHKKPVGIYWLQSLAVATAAKLGAPDALRTIGFYRVPSFLAAVGSVLTLYWAAIAFLSRRGAFVAAALMSATVLLGVEARLAKTDATLLLTCLVCFGVLARLWFHATSPDVSRPLKANEPWLFWIAMGVGVLVKGPITPLIAFVPVLALALRERSARWLLPLRPWLGIMIVLVIAAPWLVAIAVKSGGSFFADSIGRDMLGKVNTGQERHWGPPGLYAGIFWATAWPAAVFMALAFRFAWVERRDDAVTFLLAWIIPCWVIFEVVQTKLPHYVLPLYPAVVILAVLAVERDGVPFHWRSARWASALALLVPLLLLAAGTVAAVPRRRGSAIVLGHAGAATGGAHGRRGAARRLLACALGGGLSAGPAAAAGGQPVDAPRDRRLRRALREARVCHRGLQRAEPRIPDRHRDRPDRRQGRRAVLRCAGLPHRLRRKPPRSRLQGGTGGDA
jgi:4-amino-4-deoxy-L-arabinose transferase-like glycosyltransferase